MKYDLRNWRLSQNSKKIVFTLIFKFSFWNSLIGHERIFITGIKKSNLYCMILRKNTKEYIMIQKLKLVWLKVNISQNDLAGILSISRQTYCQIENGNRVMSWNMYLSLIFFFDSLEETLRLISLLGIYPEKVVKQIRVKSQSKPKSNPLMVMFYGICY